MIHVRRRGRNNRDALRRSSRPGFSPETSSTIFQTLLNISMNEVLESFRRDRTNSKSCVTLVGEVWQSFDRKKLPAMASMVPRDKIIFQAPALTFQGHLVGQLLHVVDQNQPRFKQQRNGCTASGVIGDAAPGGGQASRGILMVDFDPTTSDGTFHLFNAIVFQLWVR